MAKRRKAIVCFDGLTRTQFSQILTSMPAMRSLIEKGAIAELDSSPFSDAHPIWAEVLTGEPWYRNGCTGFATPSGSLNWLQIFEERNLKTPVQLIEKNAMSKSIVVNVPLLSPHDDERIWLSDGSTPSVKNVSPQSLSRDTPLRDYVPHPFSSMGAALADSKKAVLQFIESEKNRLFCAHKLTKEQTWHQFIYRASVFDALAHLLGPYFIGNEKLSVTSHLNELLQTLDQTLTPILVQCEQALVVSTFSHVQCYGCFSFDDALASSRLLRREIAKSRLEEERTQAVAAMHGVANEPQNIPVTVRSEYIPRFTLCASPVRGSIYLNTVDKFVDGGKIDGETMRWEEERVAKFFADCTAQYKTAQLIKNPSPDLGGPNFVFHIEGIDLVDTTSQQPDHSYPLSTHSSRGFIWSKHLQSDKVYAPIDIVSLHSRTVVV